ncbi:lytic transglycosylase domain-containing protein [Desulfomarina sp.]
MIRKIDLLLCAVIAGSMTFLVWTEGRAAMFMCRNARGGTQFTNVPSMPGCYEIVLKGGTMGRVSFGGSKEYNPERYDREISRVSRKYKVDPFLIKAIIHTESGFDHRAVSKRGARGLMQLMPDTARELHVRDSFNARQNIDAGTRYFKRLLDMFKGNVRLSLAAYNAGPRLVQELNDVPPFPETVRYVKKVLDQYRRYKISR